MTWSGNQPIASMSLCSQTQTYNSIFYLLDPDLFLKPTSPQFLLETVWINRYVRSTPPGTRLFRAKNSSVGIQQGFPDCFKDKARVCNQPVTALSSSFKQTQKKDCLREELSLLPRDSSLHSTFHLLWPRRSTPVTKAWLQDKTEGLEEHVFLQSHEFTLQNLTKVNFFIFFFFTWATSM